MGFFKNILDFLGIGKTSPENPNPPKDKVGGRKPFDKVDGRISQLDATIKELRERKKYVRTDDAEWFKISTEEKEEGKKVAVFKPRAFGDVVTLASLKQERIRKEKERIAKLTAEILGKIQSAHNEIKANELSKAEELFAAIGRLVNEVPDKSVRNKYVELHFSLEALRKKVKEEEEARRLAELKRQEEERKRKEEEERKRKEEQAKREAEIRERKRKEEEERIERERKYQEELRRKEEAERQERDRLIAINSERKEEAEEILAYLKKNGIRCLYHFTDKRNLTSIRTRGGLLSCKYLQSNNVNVPNMGGDYHAAFSDFNLRDYVRVSFCDDLPMAYRLWERNNKSIDIVLLKIDLEVATFKPTMFSDLNASDRSCSFGQSLDFIKDEINLSATQRDFVKATDPDFSPRQAEVMIKTFLPIKYIVNIDHPQILYSKQ